MVYSAELGYDPDEWEECPPPDHFLAFGFFTRILLTIGIIIFGTFFFWLLEAHKEWDKLSDKEKDEKEEQPKIEVKNTPPVVHVPPILDSVEVRTGTRPGEVPKPRKASLTKEETEALLEWERELKKVEEQRLGELEDIIAGGESDQSKSFALPSNAFDNQSQFQELPQLAHRELHRVKAECGATPPSTPPGSLVDTEVLSQEYRKLAKDLERKLLAEIEQLSRQEVLENDARKMSQVLKQHHEDSIRAAVDHLQKESGAPEYVAEQMKKQLEDKIDDTIWQYQNQNQASAQPSLGGITRAEIHTQPQENIMHDNRGDQRDDVEASFTFRPSPPRQLNQEPESQRKPSESPRTIPAVMINDEQMQERMSSSSEDGFIKVYEEDAFEQPQSTGFKRPFQLTSELQNQELISGK
uniref:Uncharacterized protein n=1 Tax=Acrobeloides nanus TaxID=290746 RepID=A0A914CNP6_9BILA